MLTLLLQYHNGVTATVSPVGTTFVNNGSGISTGGPISMETTISRW